MGKKLFSLCMALTLCLGLLPATALAVTPRIAYDILWIGNTRITDSGYWTTDGNGNLMASDAGNYNIAFDADTNTLTLNNANIAGQYNFTYNNVDAGIYAYSRSGAVSLTIQVTGNNVVSGSSGIYALSNGGEVSVTISGGGSLTASGSWNGISIVSEFSSAALAIEGTALKASGSYGDGVQVQAGESSSGSLSVNGGSLTASGNTGIYFYFSTGDSGSGIPSLTVAGNAVVDAKGGGIAHNSSNNLSIQGNSGIVFNGSTGTVYGNASLQEDLIIGEGESLTLDNGASLDANGHNVIVDGGTLDEGIKNSLGNSVKYTPTITTTSLPNGTAEAAYSTTLLADGTAPITWSVTSGSLPEGLSLDASTGMISGTPTAEGGSTFTVTAANAYGSDSREFTLSIDKPVVIPVTGVKLDKTSLTLQETGSDTLTVTVEPDNATSKNVNWESSDTSIATVDASGKVTAISAGSVTITVAAADGSGVSASCSVTVTHGNMVHTPKKDATCTADGNKEYWTCGTCGKIFSDAEGKTEIELSATVIPATGHNLTKTEENAPTCTAEGNTEYWTCGTCRKHFSDEEGKTEIELSATVIPATGHNLTKTEEKAPTCTADGNKEYWTCGTCGKHFSDEEGKTEIELSATVIPAVGHRFSGGTCTVCGAPDPNYTPPYIPPSKPNWTSVARKLANAQPGDTVTVKMNGETEVPGEVWETIAGRDVTVVLDMGGNVSWTVDGNDVPIATHFADMDFGVDRNTTGIDVDVINAITGEVSSVQITLAHDGEFGFTLTLTAPLGHENAGRWANLYHYNEDAESLSYETSGEIQEDGTASLKMTHASQYAIIIDEQTHQLPFEDVASGAWYEGAVRYAYLHDIMEGMSATTFQPNGTLTRAQAVQNFYNLEGQPDISGENLGYPYEDVNAQAWYGNAVYWARITGVATGYGDGTFQPGDSITRQEFAQMLYNYAKYKGYDLTAEGDLSQFPDSGSVADWAEAAMSWANGNELINGHDNGTIDAGGAGTRAQAASILMRFDQNLVEK